MFSRLAISKPNLSSSKYSTKASEYIKSLLKLLPEEFAIPLYMYDLEHISQKDIAEKLKLNFTKY